MLWVDHSKMVRVLSQNEPPTHVCNAVKGEDRVVEIEGMAFGQSLFNACLLREFRNGSSFRILAS